MNRRHLLAGAAATAACAAIPAAAAIEAVETAPVVMEAGASLLYGSFEPDAIGVDGDTYIDIITDDVWQKASGAWRLVVNICGRESA